MNENAQIQKEEEISLMDLFTVLLRYRKLIIGITMAFILLAVAGYFIYPVRQYNKIVNDREVQGSIIISIKQNMINYVTKNPEYFINRADVVMDSMRDAGMDNFKYTANKTISLTDEAERTKALYLINQILILNKNLSGRDKKESKRIFQVITNKTKEVKTVIRDDNSVEVIFRYGDAEFIRSFLQRLVVRGNVIAGDYIRSLAEAAVNSYESIMDGTNKGLVWQNEGYNLFYYSSFKDFLEGKEPILTALGEPVITELNKPLDSLRSGYMPIGVILVFAGFFLSVILAYVLNIIRNIKNDEEAMKKIRDAMGKSGEK